MRRASLLLFCFTSVMLLAGCGSGGSDSGGGGSRGVTPFGSFAGTYSGTETLEVSGPGGTVSVGTFPLVAAIDSHGSVTVTDISAIPHTGQMINNTFVASAFVSIPSPAGITCLPSTYAYSGTILGGAITGTSVGFFSCFGPGGAATISLGGPFAMTRDIGAGPSSPTSTPPTSQSPGQTFEFGGGNRRQSHKQQAVSEGVGSVL